MVPEKGPMIVTEPEVDVPDEVWEEVPDAAWVFVPAEAAPVEVVWEFPDEV